MIVFGLTGVLTDVPSTDARSLVQRLAGRSDEEFWVEYHLHRPSYLKGELTSEEYWTLVAPEATDVASLVWADTASHLNFRPDMSALIDELPGPKAILANVPLPVARAADNASWAKHFVHRIYSSDIGFAMPDSAAYRALCAQVDRDPASLLLVDDRRENVVAARAFGVPSLVFTSCAALRTALQPPETPAKPTGRSRPSPFSGQWWYPGPGRS